MAVTQDKPAPYAPASAILEIIQTHRRKGLTSFTADVLQRVGDIRQPYSSYPTCSSIS